jgi:hypothetical protein
LFISDQMKKFEPKIDNERIEIVNENFQSEGVFVMTVSVKSLPTKATYFFWIED